MNYYSYPRSCLTFGLSRRSLFVARALYPSIKRSWFLLNLRRCVMRTTMDNNNTWFKVQNVSHVSPRGNRAHAEDSARLPACSNRGIYGSLISGAASLQRSPHCTKNCREKGGKPQKQNATPIDKTRARGSAIVEEETHCSKISSPSSKSAFLFFFLFF